MLKRLAGIVDLIGIHRIFDGCGMCQFQTPTLYLRDILMSKHLMGFTIEHFGPLRMRLAQGHVGHSLDGFYQLGTI